ncbi:MAG: hypothetical protein PHV68_04740 [Candidatus Gastranaerophilales bacterium]|nr:hypothetical protein [Candidatus Gastranaerophilales bacterium]
MTIKNCLNMAKPVYHVASAASTAYAKAIMLQKYGLTPDVLALNSKTISLSTNYAVKTIINGIKKHFKKLDA